MTIKHMPAQTFSNLEAKIQEWLDDECGNETLNPTPWWPDETAHIMAVAAAAVVDGIVGVEMVEKA